ncbi:MAG: Ig-like domain repeat protein [Candidatus Eisenbacteria bacterium]
MSLARRRIAPRLVTALLALCLLPGLAQAQATIDVGPPDHALTTGQPQATFPVTLTRATATPVLGFSVSFTRSGNLTLPAGTASIVAGTFLTATGATATLQVRDLGGGHFAADGVTLGSPCGSTALGGTLFTISVASPSGAGTGTITIDAVSLRDCTNQALSAVAGTNGSVSIDQSPPAVTVVSPNGGETFDAGATHSILWSASDAEGVASIDLEWSGDAGSTWSPIAIGLGNSGSFPWPVPEASTAIALVRATAHDGNGNTAADVSDAVFAVRGTTSTGLSAAPQPGVLLEDVALTAVVTPSAAAGTVEFFQGSTLVGSATLAAGSAVLHTSGLAIGSLPLSATYGGSTVRQPSSSAALAFEVQAKIVATAGPNGSIAPAGTVLTSMNSTPSFALLPDAGYHVASVTVDGGAVATISPYTFAAVTSNHTIDVQFEANPPVPAITTLAASTVRTGNGPLGIQRIRLTWSPVAPGSTVEVWRAPFGNYPEYDDGPTPGSVPAIPSYPPPSPWVLTSVTASGQDDLPPARDFYYHVAFVTDGFGTRSPVSNRTAGALAYALGDISDGLSAGFGDNRVFVADLSLLGSVYGRTLVPGDAANFVDIGPTTNFSVNARPTTDNVINFEDLVLFGLNFDQVSAPATVASATGAERDEVRLDGATEVAAGEQFDARLVMRGTGAVHAGSVALGWDPDVIEWVTHAPGAFASDGRAVVLSPGPGTVDFAVLGAHGPGVTGESELATLTFRARRAGPTGLRIARVLARDTHNQPIALANANGGSSGPALKTALAAPRPTPSSSQTEVAFTLGARTHVRLALHGVDGRRIRTLLDEAREAGEHRLEWDGRDDAGRAVPAGVYYLRFTSEQGSSTRKLTYLH